MQGKATVMGHPIHPMLIPFPIAFFTGALVCDIISHWGDATFWPRMAVVLVGLGIIGALVAAIFGFIDYLSAPMSADAKKTASSHMVINLIAVVIFVVDYFIRSANATATLGYVLTTLGVVVLSAGGALGGHLAYHFGVGVEDRARS